MIFFGLFREGRGLFLLLRLLFHEDVRFFSQAHEAWTVRAFVLILLLLYFHFELTFFFFLFSPFCKNLKFFNF